ncbi:PepSY domain-containing protein [Chitinophaga sp. Mgbs1]|uniref:PepSY domain-containing protein n=1 Tax=Chitinophaga solisilvae TaxID=1233460 RepID=A0A3S1DIS0_9BACT|nr:PepSY domain-containing protein [Chitinophaga solisilvae]
MQTGSNQRITPKQKKKSSLFSRINAWLHLWLGLSSGIVIFVVCLTGTMFVFCDDIIDLISRKALTVQETGAVQKKPEELIAIFKQERPDFHPFYFVAYKDPERSFKIAYEDKEDHFHFAWMDPYTGKILDSNGAYYFFYVVAHIHSQLLLHEPGNIIVEIATWIFLLELIGGLILWWPKKWTKATREQSFRIKWNGKWKRVNYDLHNVLGFYSLLPALMLTITGLIIVNHFVNGKVHQAFNGQSGTYKAMRKAAPAYVAGSKPFPLDSILLKYLHQPGVEQLRMTIPAKDSMTSCNVVAGKEIGLKGYNGRMFLVNRFTGEEVKMADSWYNGEKVENINMNLHLGFWYGAVGKTITFIIGLICTSLPITGFMIWWNRKKKKSPVRISSKQTVTA